MRFAMLLLSILMAMTTQSCRIEMPPLIQLIGRHDPLAGDFPSAYDFTRSEAIRVQGFRDTLLLGDEPGSTHAIQMQNILEKAGVPRKNIVLFDGFRYIGGLGNEGLYFLTSGDHEALRKATRIVHVPFLTPLRKPQDAPRIAANNIVFVLSAGNVRESFNGDRDMYNVNHTRWNHDDPEIDSQYKVFYQSILDVYNTGKAIAATSAELEPESWEVEPSKFVVSCGDIKESCFTVVPGQFTSSASARLASMSFYLSQFYPTTEEIIETLQVCAVDIGEPGIDREYGWGLANLFCPRVLENEMDIVSMHLKEEAKEPFTPKGGILTGTWRAANVPLRIHLPSVLERTLRVRHRGTATGTVTFDAKGGVDANFTLEADINVVFFTDISASAIDEVRVEGIYTSEESNSLTLESEDAKHTYAYTVTEDSLHLVRLVTLHEALTWLPSPLGDLTNTVTKDLLSDDPLRITASFRKLETPTAPRNLREEAKTSSTATLVWDTPRRTGGAGIDSYQITRYADDSCVDAEEVKETTRRRATFTNLTANTPHYFTARARNDIGWSPRTDCIAIRTEAMTPTAPRNLREEAKTDSSVTLVWDEPEETGGAAIEGYRVTVYMDQRCTEQVTSGETEEKKITFFNLEDDTDHYFSVEAKNEIGWSSRSHCIVVRTEKRRIPGDFNDDDRIDFADFLLFVAAFGSTEGDAAYDPFMDLDEDGSVAFGDFIIFVSLFEQQTG